MEAILIEVDLQKGRLREAQLQGASLRWARLQGTNLRGVQLQEASIKSVVLSDKQRIGPLLADVQWGNTDLTQVEWSQVVILGDEWLAQQKRTFDGTKKERSKRLGEYRMAARANRQLATALQTQGLNEDAVRFTYRAQALQRSVSWFEMIQPKVSLQKRMQALGAWLFAWFLFLLAGYGYKLGRSFLAYLLVIGTFTVLYLLLNPQLAWYEAVVVSMTAFHLSKVRHKDEQGHVTDMSSMSAVRLWVEGSGTDLATRLTTRACYT